MDSYIKYMLPYKRCYVCGKWFLPIKKQYLIYICEHCETLQLEHDYYNK